MHEPRAREVLEYWFGDLDHTPEYFEGREKLWFGGGDALDAEIRATFGADLERAARGELEAWAGTPRGLLALIVVLDQFSLNINREKPASYIHSEMAIRLTERMLERGWDWTLTPAERMFVLLPLEHSERIAHQERSVELHRRLANSAPAELRGVFDGHLDYAIRHERVVREYGRFPDRNEVFGRESTPESSRFSRRTRRLSDGSLATGRRALPIATAVGPRHA